MRGIDVSYYQGAPDWKRVKAAGISFAMVKGTQGKLVSDAYSGPFADPQFLRNVEQARTAGLDVGVYHYLCARDSAQAEQEAEYFIRTAAPVKNQINLWAAIDAEEDKYLPGNREGLTTVVRHFADVIRAAGYRPMLYTNPNYLRYKLGDVSELPLWLAYWGTTEARAMAYHPLIWQRGTGNVDGIAAKVDENFGYFDPPSAPIQRGDRVRVLQPLIYGTRAKFKAYYDAYDVMSISGARAVIGVGGVVTAAVDVKNLEKCAI